jgi:hypothetical protein
MKKLLIVNDVNYHYEIIESIIVNYYKILNIKDEKLIIYLQIKNNNSYIKYIKEKYPNIILSNTNNFDYYINCTIYDYNYKSIINKNNYKYISHDISNRLIQNDNIWYLSPFSKKNYFRANILPFTNEKINTNIPVYIIQGNLNDNRRNLNLLIKILENDYIYDFKIKLIGRGVLPEKLYKYRNKILLKNNLNFIDYHKEFLDSYCILPLITKKSHPQYYTKKLTSSINYAIAYNILCLIDKDLQDIYQLNNVEIYNNENDIGYSFIKTLKDFYESKN